MESLHIEKDQKGGLEEKVHKFQKDNLVDLSPKNDRLVHRFQLFLN